LAAALYRERFRYVNEIELQDSIETLLTGWGLPFAREFILSPKDRIDFLVGTLGLEVKIGSSLAAVQRQLWRYAADPRITALILITSKSAHKRMPASISEKPIYVVHLINSFL
jgi:hypothetical protein